jgi:ribosomal protein S18 acetylase RimI-like enzyme
MNLTILKATPADLDEILALQKLAFHGEAEFYGDFDIPPMTDTIDDIREEFRTRTFLKAVVGDRIVGSVRAHEEDGTCLIGRLIVHPDFRRRGIATGLMREIESCFPGAACFELFTGHLSEGSIRLYEGLGYRRLPAGSPPDEFHLVHMRKAGDPRPL